MPMTEPFHCDKYWEPLSLRDIQLMSKLDGVKLASRPTSEFNRQGHIVAFVQGLFHRFFRWRNVAPVSHHESRSPAQ